VLKIEPPRNGVRIEEARVSVDQIAESPRTRRGAELVFGAVLVALGLLLVAVPSLLARRFSFAAEHEEAIARVLRAGGPAILAMATAAFVASTRWVELRPGAAALAIGLLNITRYVSLTTPRCTVIWRRACVVGWKGLPARLSQDGQGAHDGGSERAAEEPQASGISAPRHQSLTWCRPCP
jgi:hypothetical protein